MWAISNGSLPTSYYQPMAKLWVPVSKHVQAFAQWWFYGYSDAFYSYQGFGTHLAAIGSTYCRMCGSCNGVCDKGIPVPEVLRYLTYAEGYGQFKTLFAKR